MEDLVGRPFLDLVVPKEWDRVGKALRGGETFVPQVEVAREEGRRFFANIRAAYRKKETQVEVRLSGRLVGPQPQPEIVSSEEIGPDELPLDVKAASVEIKKIGDQMVKVQFIEFVGKRRKKVTHIEVRQISPGGDDQAGGQAGPGPAVPVLDVISCREPGRGLGGLSLAKSKEPAILAFP